VNAPAKGNTPVEGFTASREQFESVIGFLDGTEAGSLSHSELEDRLQVESRALLRRLLPDHLDLRAVRESRVTVIGADGAPRGRVETGHTRGLATVFGPVKVGRIAYRTPGRPNLHPGDGLLNLPVERHSHGLRRLAAIESARGSFEAAAQAIGRVTGQQPGKRQVEDLARRAAVDFDAFYATGNRRPPRRGTCWSSPVTARAW